MHKTIERMIQVLGATREVVLARELTKRFETVHRCSLGALNQAIMEGIVTVKGEMVIIVAGAKVTQPSEKGEIILSTDKAVEVLLDQLSVKDAATILSRISGLSQSKAYALCLSRKKTR